MINIPQKMKIILIITLSIFVVSLICLGVSLAVDIIDNNSSYGVVGSGGDGGGKKQPSTPVDSTVSGVGKKTSIVLPCATKEGVYLGVSNENTKDISSDEAIKSGAAVLVDITDNVVVAGKNADTKIYPASMTKVMTLLVACENASDPNKLLTVTKEMAEKYKDPTNQGASIAKAMKEGDQITVEDALYMVIYESDTMACWLLADYVAGGEAQFVQMMNARSATLGLNGTNFVNCTGLYNVDHYTTCNDMAAIMAAAMNNDTAAKVLMRTELYTVDVYTNGEITETVNMYSGWYTGRLEKYRLSGTAPKYAGNGSDIMLIGGKTGYEDIPAYCYVTAGQDDTTGRRYVCVQVGRINSEQEYIGEKQSTNDTRTIYQKYAKEPQ